MTEEEFERLDVGDHVIVDGVGLIIKGFREHQGERTAVIVSPVLPDLKLFPVDLIKRGEIVVPDDDA